MKTRENKCITKLSFNVTNGDIAHVNRAMVLLVVKAASDQEHVLTSYSKYLNNLFRRIHEQYCLIVLGYNVFVIIASNNETKIASSIELQIKYCP